MFSQRFPAAAETNRWNERLAGLRRAGAPLLDLTLTNPTAAGLPFDGGSALARLADPRGAFYDPDPRGIASARESVATYYREKGRPVTPGQVVLTASTSEAYAHLFRLLADAGGEFLAPAPSYPLFEPLSSLEAVGLRHYPLRYAGRWWLDRAGLAEAAAARPGARGLVLVQPNNPTGSFLDESEIEAVVELAARHALPLIVDEVFLDFASPAGAPLANSLAGRDDVLTFVMSGLSKVCGLPQLKLGWIVVSGPSAPRARALAGLEWIADTFLSVATPVQLALPGLLAERHPFQAAVHERLAANEARLRECLAGRPVSVRERQGGWSIILDLPRVRRDEEWSLELMEAGLLLHPGHFYDITEEASLVASLLTPPAAWADGIDRLVDRVTRG